MPTTISKEEAKKIIAVMPGKYKLIASLLFGSGLRINEALRLRIKDINFENKTIFIFRGKGAKDRYKSCWAILTFALLKYTLTSLEKSLAALKAPSINGF